jgi:hypothetical protein
MTDLDRLAIEFDTDAATEKDHKVTSSFKSITKNNYFNEPISSLDMTPVMAILISLSIGMPQHSSHQPAM